MDSSLVTVLLPAALALIMLGLGLSLTVADFRRVAQYPVPVAVALVCQIVVLPAVCLGLVLLFDLPAVLAVGMMLLAASPGGTTANLYSHLFGGDVALNITLTAVNSVLAVFTMPIVTNLSLAYFSDGDTALGLRFDKTLQVFAVVLVPVAVGMLVRARFTEFAERMAKPVKVLSAVILLLVIAGAVAKEAEFLRSYLADVGLITFVFSVLSLAVGYGAARLARADHGQAVASCMEIGLHNSTLAITFAVSPALLNSSEMAVPAAVYGVLMFFTAGAAGFLLSRRARTGSTEAETPVPHA
ncbi:bile acid:sodium symporter family protein [Streptomyces zhihengii]|uniref:Bile acid:sodium symporter family protein n=1 Tax=Streptomyces zhihengii TaxID=1818004 RepID=A0ABS2UJV0_9ACTN|nr:bile acid:sodium symporter family protein [Streptomyces zhihengii]MBM9617659.1 bile acid:sodium symporter family protein [Streptomyces zhihengii]